MNKVGTKDNLLSHLNPIEWGAAPMSVQYLEQCHLQTLLVAVVVQELSPWQILVPTTLMFQHAGPYHILQYLVHSLYLSIHLWVIGQTVD
jgi:hypothetical protein